MAALLRRALRRDPSLRRELAVIKMVGHGRPTYAAPLPVFFRACLSAGGSNGPPLRRHAAAALATQERSLIDFVMRFRREVKGDAAEEIPTRGQNYEYEVERVVLVLADAPPRTFWAYKISTTVSAVARKIHTHIGKDDFSVSNKNFNYGKKHSMGAALFGFENGLNIQGVFYNSAHLMSV